MLDLTSAVLTCGKIRTFVQTDHIGLTSAVGGAGYLFEISAISGYTDDLFLNVYFTMSTTNPDYVLFIPKGTNTDHGASWTQWALPLEFTQLQYQLSTCIEQPIVDPTTISGFGGCLVQFVYRSSVP